MSDGTHSNDKLIAAFPRERPRDEGTFEIGLVLAGAVSAGAYTAGVLDFLFEALDTWRRAVREDRDAGRTGGAATVPDHKVKLRIITGASAGGMNGAIAAAILNSAYTSGRPHYPNSRPDEAGTVPAGNPFYDAWVKEIDIRMMLDTGDLKDGVKSFLNCEALEAIVARVLTAKGAPVDPRIRDWLDDPLQLLLTVTNLRGVPYAVNFRGGGEKRHGMTVHRDHVGFAVPVPRFGPGTQATVPFDLRGLPEDRGSAEWKELGAAALATGAFPLALRPIALSRATADYGYRHPFHPEGGPVTFGSPAFDLSDRNSPAYDFLCVDGGAMNNEPFDLAHAALAGLYGSNPRKGLEAHRAVVMVDPFVDPIALGPAREVGMGAAALALLSAYRDQARYSPQDWALIQAEDVFSRFLVAPARGRTVDGARAIAGGGLEAFLGFFAEAYRHHDFLLGRRNCQWFLKSFFTLPAGNPLFGAWKTRPEYRDVNDPEFRQIIPCVGDCDRPEPLPAWPQKRATLADLEAPIKDRIHAVMRQLIKDTTEDLPPLKRFGARAYLSVGRLVTQGSLDRRVLSMISDAIKDIDSGRPDT